MAATYLLVFDAAGNPDRLKCDFAAAAAPTAADTFAAGGWKKGSLVYVPSTDTLWICEDETTAKWVVVGATAAAATAGYWTPLIDSGTGDLIRDSGTNEVIMAFVPTP